MASKRQQAGLPTGRGMRKLVLEVLRTMPMPVHRLSIGDAVADHLGLTESQRAVRQPGQSQSRSYVSWWSEFACNDLKHIGICKQPAKGLYQLTELGRTISDDQVEDLHRTRIKNKGSSVKSNPTDAWEESLLERLLKMKPQGFEHLTGALLEAAGFHDVTVTKGSSDGGVDAFAEYRPQGLISFRTAVQCQRWTGGVGPDRVQAFQGASSGKADRGILITTGHFTKSAQEQAKAAGAFPVDLIDGMRLAELLKEYGLGVRTTTVELVTLDETYFSQFE